MDGIKFELIIKYYRIPQEQIERGALGAKNIDTSPLKHFLHFVLSL